MHSEEYEEKNVVYSVIRYMRRSMPVRPYDTENILSPHNSFKLQSLLPPES